MTSPEPTPLWDLPSPAPVLDPPRKGAAGRKRGAGRKGQRQPAETDPVARVIVDVPLAHLDRTFDYRVPRELDDAAVPGCRVRVRFAGQLVDGFLVERGADTEHTGTLAFLERVTSSEPVLPPRLAALCRAVAQRYGGTLIDVLRLALPPRHAKVEGEPAREPAATPPRPAETGWPRYPRGPVLAEAL
ncbi:primosomal protein N' family DNA-binding protein, partial [Amycolatopsis cihanbeyliensis]